ncbi:PEGA domain-containing protein [Desulfurobacterium atlanticum]|uniref:PEGA domain-containing protein n=1 Tax=Desulfurobacterium atlanticum TaxID=240169 RepID=A0A238YY85_9BACT|nr:PEGA domain-containing protein [Desulfurobacterium atlanticum]SNR75593.1 PEGA domain-containing protein [Desulfurobacterium atlanticum]
MRAYFLAILSLLLSLFSCVSANQNVSAKTNTSVKDPEIRAVEEKAEKAFNELEGEFKSEEKEYQYPVDSEKTESRQNNESQNNTPAVKKEKPVTLKGRVIFKECAFGKNKTEARATALKRISQDIISNVSAVEVVKKQLKNRKITREYFSSTLIGTETLLKGVFFEDRGRKKEGYEVCAVLTDEGVRQTVDYLKSFLKRDLSALSKDELRELKKKAFLLISIAEAVNDKKNVNFALKKIGEIDKYLNYGRLVVITVPEDAVVKVDGKVYRAGKTILLKPDREYFVEIARKGYKSVREKIYLSRGEKKTISLELPKKISFSVPVVLKIDFDYARPIVEKLLIDSGFIVTNSAPNVLDIKIRDFKTKVKGYEKHELEVVATLLSNGKPVVMKRGKMKPFFTTDQTHDTILKEKAEKLVKAVINSLLNSVDTEKLSK